MSDLLMEPQAASTPADVGEAQAIRLLHDLVATTSNSGLESAAVERFVHHSRALGLRAEIDEAGNGIATRRGEGPSHRHIVLLGHIDTVPGNIPVRIEDGFLHGRGAVDAKGPLAAMLVAAATVDLSPGVRLDVVAAVGEEADSPGARFLRDRLRPDACIIGEPSGADGVTLGYKGRLLVDALCRRPCVHSAGPEGSPADALVHWWIGVQGDVASLNDDRERVFDRVQASVEAMRSDSDGLTASAQLTLGFRLPPHVPPSLVEALLRQRAAGLDITIEVRSADAAHATTRRDPVVCAISSAIREQGLVPRPRLKTGTSDMNVVADAWACPIAAYGPGDSALDHTAEERLEIAEYLRAIRVLVAALRTLAA